MKKPKSKTSSGTIVNNKRPPKKQPKRPFPWWTVLSVMALLLALLIAWPAPDAVQQPTSGQKWQSDGTALAGMGTDGIGTGMDDAISPEHRELFSAAAAFFESDQQVKAVPPEKR